ncbi:MAG TPA: ABC transporter ATP-binding protein [Candidatus Limnocylindria bacterium]|nr:ABC transporter ATP-binding protein [Candidatus Limnocylindria bacterium]
MGSPGTDAPLIAVEQLTKFYGATRAVSDVSFGVGRGEVAALLGPNGSGKSTLMRCLIGFFSPTSGRVLLDGRDVTMHPVRERSRIGYLPEQVMLYPELTVRRYLRFVAGAKGLSGTAARAAVEHVIEACGLGPMASRFAGTLSKGYRQRVGLAQALLGDPDVLVLDEPTVGLDPMQTVEMRALLKSLARCTVLLSTHLLAEASQLCRRVIVLKEGRLVADDTPEGLARRLGWTNSVVVRIDGPPEDVRAALAELAGVSAVESRPEAAGAGRTWVVRTSDARDVQARLASLVVARGWTLLEIRAEEPTLEDLFVRLVG